MTDTEKLREAVAEAMRAYSGYPSDGPADRLERNRQKRLGLADAVLAVVVPVIEEAKRRQLSSDERRSLAALYGYELGLDEGKARLAVAEELLRDIHGNPDVLWPVPAGDRLLDRIDLFLEGEA